MLCADLLYTRKDNTALKDMKNIYELYEAPDEDELLSDKRTAIARAAMYLKALADENEQYMDHYPPIAAGARSSKAVDLLEKTDQMHLTAPEPASEGKSLYDYARKLAGGMGRAYMGYSKAMHAMGESASVMEFRLFSHDRGQ